MADPAQETPEKSSNSLSLAEALLAPLNSIFEAQIHASRAFLGYLFQMGFRHIYTEADKRKIKKDFFAMLNSGKRTFSSDQIQTLIDNDIKEPQLGWIAFLNDLKSDEKLVKVIDELEETFNILKKINDEEKDKVEIDTLSREIRALSVRQDLDPNEIRSLADKKERAIFLKKKWPDLFIQEFGYLDQNNNERVLQIPNLALLPVKPLAIQSANFKFELMVKESNKQADSTIRSAAKAVTKRPWFLIDDPKTIQGEFVAQQNENSTDKTIKIDVTIGSVDMPYGLHKLINSLTNTAEDNEKKPIDQ